jgi:hypothetical protein
MKIGFSLFTAVESTAKFTFEHSKLNLSLPVAEQYVGDRAFPHDAKDKLYKHSIAVKDRNSAAEREMVCRSWLILSD